MTAIKSLSKKYTFEEYCLLEENSVEKHEFHNGKLVQMSGGTLEHSLIKVSIVKLLASYTEEVYPDYYVFDSDTKVYIPSANRGVYPDASLVMGTPTFPKINHAITNPTIVVEVLSKATAAYDRGDKFDLYCTLPSFKEYIIIAADKPKIEVFYREDLTSNLWKITKVEGLDQSIQINSIDYQLSLKEVYKKVIKLKKW